MRHCQDNWPVVYFLVRAHRNPGRHSTLKEGGSGIVRSPSGQLRSLASLDGTPDVSMAQLPSNFTTSSSAIRTMGGPPFEILCACAMASRPACDAAHNCKASAEGKWISARR